MNDPDFRAAESPVAEETVVRQDLDRVAPGETVVRRDVSRIAPAETVVRQDVRRVVPEQHEEAVEANAGVVRRERAMRNAAGDESREVVYDDVEARQYLWAAKLSQIVWFIIAVIDTLIGLRIVLRVLAASPDTGFTSFIYNTAGVFLAPFFGITGSPSAGGSVVEVPSIIAAIVYLIIGWFAVQLIWLVLDRPQTGGVSHYRRFHI